MEDEALATGLVGRPGAVAQALGSLRITVTVVVGDAEMSLRELLDLAPGAVVHLNRLVGEPVDVLIAGSPVARGELVTVDGRLAVRLVEIRDAEEDEEGE